MIESNNYKLEDFTFKHYKKLIKTAKEKFAFSSFKDFTEKEKFIISRHDIDYSPENALIMAKIEEKLKVKSTYYIMLHSEYYNILEKHNTNIILEILSLGHDIGLHFDPSFYNIKKESALENKITLEREFLEKIFGIEMYSFSFHNTNNFILSCKKSHYAGLLNNYNSYFQNELDYCSDSYGIWRFNRMFEVITNPKVKKLQILTHPVLWSEKPMPPHKRVYSSILKRKQWEKAFYNDFLKKNGMSFIKDIL